MYYFYKHPQYNWMQLFQKSGMILPGKEMFSRYAWRLCSIIRIQNCSIVKFWRCPWSYGQRTASTNSCKNKNNKQTQTLKAHSISQMFLNVQMFGTTWAKLLDNSEMFLVITRIFCFLWDCISILKTVLNISDSLLNSQGNPGHNNFECELFPDCKKCSVLSALLS